MGFGKFAAAVVAVSMATAPALAAPANPAASLSVAKSARASAPTAHDSQLRGGFIIPLVALVAIILGIIAATSGDSKPKSP